MSIIGELTTILLANNLDMLNFKVFSKIDNKFLENRHFIDNEGDLYFGSFLNPIKYENQDQYEVLFTK